MALTGVVRFMWFAGLAWMGAPLAWGAIVGLPEPPTPRELPKYWGALNDDLFGDAIIDNDDFRTGNINLGVAPCDWLVLAGDYSALTHRLDTSYTNGFRTDELTVTAGVRLNQWFPEDWRRRMELMAGIGARLNGNLGGERAQNAIHGFFGFPKAKLDYDQAPRHYQLDEVSYLYQRTRLLRLGSGDNGSTQFDLLAEGAAAATTGGEAQAYLGMQAAVFGDQGCAWIGYRYQWNGGPNASATAAVVGEHEHGSWITAGFAKKDGVYLSGGFDWKTHAITGAIGAAFAVASPAGGSDGAPKDGSAPAVLDVLPPVTNQSLEYAPGSSALGIQIRWPSEWWAKHFSDGFAGEWLVDYHFGKVAGYDWPGNEVDVDQAIVGLEPTYTWATPWAYGFEVQPFIYGAIGARIERVKITAAAHRYEQTTDGATVVQGGTGIRLRFHETQAHPCWLTHIWFGYGYDAWLPFPASAVDNGANHDHHQRPGGARQYSIGFSTTW